MVLGLVLIFASIVSVVVRFRVRISVLIRVMVRVKKFELRLDSKLNIGLKLVFYWRVC